MLKGKSFSEREKDVVLSSGGELKRPRSLNFKRGKWTYHLRCTFTFGMYSSVYVIYLHCQRVHSLLYQAYGKQWDLAL